MVGGVLIGGSWVKAVGPLLDHHSLKLDTCSTRTQKCVPPSRAERKLDFFFPPQLWFGMFLTREVWENFNLVGCLKWA